MPSASDLAQQAIDSVNALKVLAENNTGNTGPSDDIQAQLDAYASQVNDLKDKLETQENASEMYRNEILTDNEYLGFGIEIMTKIQGLLDNGVINTMPVDVQRQLQETLMYTKDRQKANNQHRQAGDPQPRTFAQFRNP